MHWQTQRVRLGHQCGNHLAAMYINQNQVSSIDVSSKENKAAIRVRDELNPNPRDQPCLMLG
ncbi:unnamed protein product [Leuciscus chuanchicus]